MLQWPSPVYVYDFDNNKFLKKFDDVKSAKRYVLAHDDNDLVIVFDKLINIKKDLPNRWVYSNVDTFDLPLTKLDLWLPKTLRSKELLADLPPGMLEYLVLTAKKAYYNTSEPIMTDAQFDKIELMLKRVFPRSTALKVGAEVEDKVAQNEGGVAPEKAELPYYMGSMNKLKDSVENFKQVGPFVITDKMDGISLEYADVKGTARLFTRGDGNVGQDVTYLLPLLSLPKLLKSQAVRGELQFSKSAFKKYANQFKNSRNMMSGMVNRKSMSNELKDASFVVFEQLNPRVRQSEGLLKLQAQGFTIPWYYLTKKISTKLLNDILLERKAKSKYEIDGIVVVDDAKHPLNTSGNPDWAFAFKNNAAFTSAQVVVTGVEWNVSRLGQLKPTVLFESVDLDGSSVARATGHNAKYIQDNKIGKGAVIEVVKSGGVIPYIEEVITKARKADMPTVPWDWDKTKTNAIERSGTSKNQAVTQLAFALRQLGIENIGVGQASMLYDLGFKTLAEVINSNVEGYLELGPKRAKELFTNLNEALEDPHPVDLMVASGLFGMGIGNTKLEALLKQYPDFATLTQKQATMLDTPKGFSTSTFEEICSTLPAFHAFLKEIGVKRSDLLLEEEKPVSTKLKGKVFLFTGVRDVALEQFITQNGGEVSSGFSKRVTHVVTKDVGTSSSKAQAARSAGIPIISLEQAYKLVGMKKG